MEMITSSQDNPNPKSSTPLLLFLKRKNRGTWKRHIIPPPVTVGLPLNIGCLGNLVQENDEFFEFISSRILSESRYSISVQAAAARVLLNCSLTWMYPHVFEDDVLECIKNWVLDDSARLSNDDGIWKHQFGEKKSSDFDMRRTYSTGLLAVCLTSGGQVVEDVLTSSLSAKLMRYLQNRVLGEMSTSQKDSSHMAESRNVSLGGGKSQR